MNYRLKKIQKRHVRKYYTIAIALNVILPLLIAISAIGSRKGEAQMGYIIIGIYGLICILIYGFYFAIPDFYRNWEKVGGLLFPSILLSIGLFEFPDLLYLVVFNLTINGFFIWHFVKKTFANKKLN